MWLVRKILGHSLFFFWLAVTSPPILLLVWLRRSHEDSAARVSWLAVPLVLVWLGGAVYLAMTTSHYMFEENYMFLKAVRLTLSDLRCKLSLIPLVGHFFT